MAKFDPIDRAILKCLKVDARMTSAQIARQVGVPERTVHNRIRKMIAAKVLRTIAVLSPVAFGYNLLVDIACELDVGFQTKAIEAILQMPEVSYVAISTGDEDISMQAVFKDGEEMNEFITHKLHQVPGMRRTRVVLIPRVVKDTYQWMPPDELFVNGEHGE